MICFVAGIMVGYVLSYIILRYLDRLGVADTIGRSMW